MCVLAIDIGGTGTKMACAKLVNNEIQLDHLRIYRSSDYPSLNAILDLYLEETGHHCRKLAVAVAGPVTSDTCQLTNLNWSINRQDIAHKFSFEGVYFLNDLEAQGYAIARPECISTTSIHENPEAHGHIAIVAPGTGLGEAFVCETPYGFLPFPSEGGHCDFSPTNQTEMELLEFVQKKHKRVSWERIISGSMGFLNIYEFFVESSRYQWDRDLDEAKIHDAATFPKELFRRAHEGLLVARKTIDLYCELLGAEAGNLVLKVMATGGLYLSGGVTPPLLPFLKDSAFYQRFTGKGRFRRLLETVPIVAVTDPHIGIKGAALRALSTHENAQ